MSTDRIAIWVRPGISGGFFGPHARSSIDATRNHAQREGSVRSIEVHGYKQRQRHGARTLRGANVQGAAAGRYLEMWRAPPPGAPRASPEPNGDMDYGFDIGGTAGVGRALPGDDVELRQVERRRLRDPIETLDLDGA